MRTNSIDRQVTGITGVIHRERGRSGWSRPELARYSGTSEATIKSVENGQHTPSLYTILNLLDALGYTLEVVKK